MRYRLRFYVSERTYTIHLIDTTLNVYVERKGRPVCVRRPWVPEYLGPGELHPIAIRMCERAESRHPRLSASSEAARATQCRSALALEAPSPQPISFPPSPRTNPNPNRPQKFRCGSPRASRWHNVNADCSARPLLLGSGTPCL